MPPKLVPNTTGGGKIKEPPDINGRSPATTSRGKPYTTEFKALNNTRNSLDLPAQRRLKSAISSQNLSNSSDLDMSQLGSQYLLNQAKTKLKPTNTNKSDVIINTNIEAVAVGGAENTSQVILPTEQVQININNQEMLSDNDDSDSESSTEPKFNCIIKSEDGHDLTKLSKIKVVGELGKSIGRFRVFPNKDKTLKVEVTNNLDLEALKRVKSLCNHDISITFQTIQVGSTAQPQGTNTTDNSRTISWGKIFSDELIYSTDGEILEQLQS